MSIFLCMSYNSCACLWTGAAAEIAPSAPAKRQDTVPEGHRAERATVTTSTPISRLFAKLGKLLLEAFLIGITPALVYAAYKWGSIAGDCMLTAGHLLLTGCRCLWKKIGTSLGILPEIELAQIQVQGSML